MATTWNSKAIEQGRAIHRRVMSEGGYMVHGDDRSWFEWYDRSKGEFSRLFSPDLMECIKGYRSDLKVYAAWRRKSMSNPPALGSFAPPLRPATPRAGVQMCVTATIMLGSLMHGFALAVPDAGGGVTADGGGIEARQMVPDGGFCVNFAPHGATGKREGGGL